MGLFDDILKKPATDPIPPADPLAASGGGAGQSGGTGGQQQDPQIIIKSESEVFGMTSEVPPPPPEPTVHAEEDYSAVLISPEKVVDAPPMATAETIAPVASTPSVVEIQAATLLGTAPSITPILSTPEIQGNLVMVNTPIMQSPSIMPIEPTLTTPTAPISSVEEKAPDLMHMQGGNSLFDHIMSDEPVAAPLTAPVQATTLDTAVVDTPITISNEDAVTNGLGTMIETSPTPTTNLSSPREFIEKSLASIAIMLANIDKKHEAKITEAEGYRLEKMRFAELEKNAYAEAEIMDRERDHAIRMERIFETELTGLGKSIQEKSKSESHEKHTHKKHTAETPTEEAVTA